MKIDDLTIGEEKKLVQMLAGQMPTAEPSCPPQFNNPVVAQFIGRFVFVCDLRIEGDYCYLTNVRNVRYWEARENGLGDLAKSGEKNGDKIDEWPDQVVPLNKLGPVMEANKAYWR